MIPLKETRWDGGRSLNNKYGSLKGNLCLMKSQYQVPPSIASASLRPDICIYSETAKKVCFVELTSPAEENISGSLRSVKNMKTWFKRQKATVTKPAAEQ